jgi:hypothetical protein
VTSAPDNNPNSSLEFDLLGARIRDNSRDISGFAERLESIACRLVGMPPGETGMILAESDGTVVGYLNGLVYEQAREILRLKHVVEKLGIL